MERAEVKRPASVTAAIVVLGMFCLASLADVYLHFRSGAPFTWFASFCGVSVFGVPLFALVTRRRWGRIYTTVLFSLLAVFLLYSNATNSTADNLVVAVGYALVIALLLAWNIVSLWRRSASTYFEVHEA